MQSMRIEYVPIDDLRPAERNARTHPPRQLTQLVAAIKEFEVISPLIVDEKNQLVAGHLRWEASKLAGLSTVPVIRVEHLSDTQKRALALALNRISLSGAWDAEILREELKDLSVAALPFDLEITGFETAEIDLIIDGPSCEVHPWDDIPAPDVQAVSRTGDHWVLGEHHLLCGDALKERSYSEVMGGEEARTVFADAPYNVPIKGHVGGLGAIQHREFAMASGEMSEAEFTQFLNTAFAHMANASMDGAIHFVCMDWRHVGEVLAASKPVYSELKNICVWNKDNGGMGSFYRSKHEFVFVLKVGTAPHVNTVQLGRTGRDRPNVWDYSGVNTFRRGRREDLEAHPTVKPTALVMDAIKDCSQRGDIVLDPFSGSGTTIIAAQKCGRRARAIEIDPLYVDVAIRRWQKITGGKAVLDVTGETFDDIAALRLAETPVTPDAET